MLYVATVNQNKAKNSFLLLFDQNYEDALGLNFQTASCHAQAQVNFC